MIFSSCGVSGRSASTVGRSRNRNSTFAMETLFECLLPATALLPHVGTRYDDRKAPAALLIDCGIDIDGIMAAQDFPHTVAGALANVAPASCLPQICAAAVAELRIDELRLHQRQCLLVVEVMARTFDGGTDALEGQRLVGD